MARHRDDAARRRVSRGPIIVVILVVVIALAVFGWFRLSDRIDNQRSSAAAACVSGPSTLVVAANDAIAPALTELGDRFSATKTVVRDHCVQVAVHAVGDQQALAGLQGTWDAATMGDPPAAWVPQDTSVTARLAAAKPAALIDKTRSVATSPLLLAAPQTAADSMRSAKLNWADLAKLQGAPDGWARFGQPSWGTTTIALPAGTGGSNSAALTVQAVAAAVSGTAPVTARTLDTPPVASALTALRQGPQPNGVTAALNALRELKGVAGSPFQAVPATEQQVFTAAGQPGPTALAGVALTGPTPAADYPYAGIKAPWVDDTQSRAAAAFAEYLNQPEQQKVLAAKGFHAGDAPLPAASPGVDFAPVPVTLPPADAATSTAVTALLSTPPVAPVPLTTTVLLDVSDSMSTKQEGTTRLQATTSALGTRIGELPDSAGVGLTTFSTDLDAGLPYRVNVPTGPLSADGRRQSLQSVLPSLSPKTGTSLNYSVDAAFTRAVRDYAAGHPNSLLVITDGRNDGRTTFAELQASIDKARDPARPVRIDVVAIGSQPDTAALRQLTEKTGGKLVQTGVAGGTTLAAAFTQLLA
ncbi:MAG: substrate-binding domain-containing protein [Mycobacteriaceae bacterium]